MSVLPQKYKWLGDEPGPAILKEALALYGTLETPGDKNNPVILAWADEVGGWIGDWYDKDSIAWCGLFVALVAKRAGFPFDQKALSALEWARWGNKAAVPMLGDVLVFKRTGGGHVGLYVGEDDQCYHVLGGNQSDSVNITRIDKSRLHAARRCVWKIKQPENVRVIKLAASGTVSENEA